MNKFIIAAFMFLSVPIVNADSREVSQASVSYVKEAECINVIANLAFVNPVMGEISMAMLGRYPACEVVAIVREAQHLSGASGTSKADVMNRTYSDIVDQAVEKMSRYGD